MPDFGSIVLVPFPFSDLTSSKVRPALVVSRDPVHRPDLILCFITSRIDPAVSRTAVLPATAKTGLKVDSTVRFDKIATLDKRVVLGEIGRADPAWLKRHRNMFYAVFGF